MLEIQLAGIRVAGPLQFPGLIQADVEPGARKQRRHLPDPIFDHPLHFRIARIQVAAVWHGGQIGVPLDAEQVVQVAVELQTRNHVHMPLARVSDDATNLVLGISPSGVDQRVAFQLDRELGVEVILIALPPRQKVDLRA